MSGGGASSPEFGHPGAGLGLRTALRVGADRQVGRLARHIPRPGPAEAQGLAAPGPPALGRVTQQQAAGGAVGRVGQGADGAHRRLGPVAG